MLEVPDSENYENGGNLKADARTKCRCDQVEDRTRQQNGEVQCREVVVQE
jgi:hypothetical protein